MIPCALTALDHWSPQVKVCDHLLFCTIASVLIAGLLQIDVEFCLFNAFS